MSNKKKVKKVDIREERQANRGQKRKDRIEYGRGKKGKAAKDKAVMKEAATAKANRAAQGVKDRADAERGAPEVQQISSSNGAAMYEKNKMGSSMDAYQDKEASMDDYSHEKKLKDDGRYEAAKGKMANAENDFDHAHALKKDASHDAKGRHAIMKHMKGFK